MHAIAGCGKLMDLTGLWGGAGAGIFFSLGHMVLLVYYFGCQKRHLLYKPKPDSDDEDNSEPDADEIGLTGPSNAPETVGWLPGVPGFPGFEVKNCDRDILQKPTRRISRRISRLMRRTSYFLQKYLITTPTSSFLTNPPRAWTLSLCVAAVT